MNTLIKNKSSHPDQKVFVDLEGYDRIRARSSEAANWKISKQIEMNVQASTLSSQNELSMRIDDLDHEWDIDRAAMLLFSMAGLTALSLGVFRNRRFLALLGIQLPFLAYHAAMGWSPPAAMLRRLGFRSSKEIDAEKYALKTLRGDFKQTA